MFFYASLFVASVVVALVLVWLYRAIANAGKAVYQAILPSYKLNHDPTSHLDKVDLETSVNEVPMPWGWQGETRLPDKNQARARIRQLRKNYQKNSAKPWGW